MYSQPNGEELMYTRTDLEAALFAAEINHLMQSFCLSLEEALLMEAENSTILAQPTTISPARRAAGLQLSLFDLPEDDAPMIPGLKRYEHGARILAEAKLARSFSRRTIAQHRIMSPVLKSGGQFAALTKN